jgi:hypothetical protein
MEQGFLLTSFYSSTDNSSLKDILNLSLEGENKFSRKDASPFSSLQFGVLLEEGKGTGERWCRSVGSYKL